MGRLQSVHWQPDAYCTKLESTVFFWQALIWLAESVRLTYRYTAFISPEGNKVWYNELLWCWNNLLLYRSFQISCIKSSKDIKGLITSYLDIQKLNYIFIFDFWKISQLWIGRFWFWVYIPFCTISTAFPEQLFLETKHHYSIYIFLLNKTKCINYTAIPV